MEFVNCKQILWILNMNNTLCIFWPDLSSPKEVSECPLTQTIEMTQESGYRGDVNEGTFRYIGY